MKAFYASFAHFNAYVEVAISTMWSEFSFTKYRVTSWSASGARPQMKNSVSNAETKQNRMKNTFKVNNNNFIYIALLKKTKFIKCFER